MHKLQKDIAAAVFAFAVASSVYWIFNQTGLISDALPDVLELGQAWFAVYFSVMALMALFVLIGVGRALSTVSWVYPVLFGSLGLLLHIYTYNFFHAGWMAGLFGNGLYIMAATFYWLLPGNVTRRSKPTPKKRRGLAER